MKESEIYQWVQKLASNRFSFDEINAVVNIFVTECGVFTLTQVKDNIDVFTKNYFLDRKVKLGFASAIVRSISSLVEIPSVVIDPTIAVPPPEYPAIKSPDNKNNTSNNNNIISKESREESEYIEVIRREAIGSSGLSEIIDCDYFHSVSKHTIYMYT